jgi:hypothetical protein
MLGTLRVSFIADPVAFVAFNAEFDAAAISLFASNIASPIALDVASDGGFGSLKILLPRDSFSIPVVVEEELDGLLEYLHSYPKSPQP